MATPRKLPDGKWIMQVMVGGKRKSKTFKTKLEARDWGARQQVAMLEGQASEKNNRTVGDLLDRYMREVSPSKRGAKWEIVRIEKLMGYPLAAVKLSDLDTDHVAAWRDQRLKEVEPGSVLREKNIISSAFNLARKEWKWLKDNPCADVRWPSEPRGRDRRITPSEIDQIIEQTGTSVRDTKGRVGLAFLFAIETAMRASEITTLTWDNVDLEKRTAHLPETKNGLSRNVPLTSSAIAILRRLEGVDKAKCFGINSRQLDVHFRKHRDATDIAGLRFHDTRHEGITRLAKKLNVLQLARAIGHENINQLQTYFNESAEDMAEMLD